MLCHHFFLSLSFIYWFIAFCYIFKLTRLILLKGQCSALILCYINLSCLLSSMLNNAILCIYVYYLCEPHISVGSLHFLSPGRTSTAKVHRVIPPTTAPHFQIIYSPVEVAELINGSRQGVHVYSQVLSIFKYMPEWI